MKIDWKGICIKALLVLCLLMFFVGLQTGRYDKKMEVREELCKVKQGKYTALNSVNAHVDAFGRVTVRSE